MTTSDTPPWRVRGRVIIACNCDYGCPCNFNGRPTTGKCEGNWNWHIDEGEYGDVSLAGLGVSIAVNWPAAIHEGNGEGIILLDARADERQREALEALISGRVGGPWKIIRTTIATTHGPEYTPFAFDFQDYTSSVRVGEYITVEMQPIRNPVTKAEVHPRAVLPEGFIIKDGQLATSSTFRIEGPVAFDHTGRYTATGAFEYQGP